MNLFDMARREDKELVLSKAVTMAKFSNSDGETWRCLRVEKDSAAQITVRHVLGAYPFCTRPEAVGWFVRTRKGSAKMAVRLMDNQRTVGSVELQIDENPRPVTIPWPMSVEPLPSGTVLILHFALEPRQVADLMVHKVLDRNELIGLAKGNGVEIGPGPRPQIANSATVKVKYVEEMPAEQWALLYDQEGQYGSKAADWSNHIVGKASSLPCDDGSLDFIFSSHLFEHLTNPIGHLEHWARKLRPGGIVLAVVPDIAGTKDYRHQPSGMDELQQEYDEGIWEPVRSHYVRWASTRGDWKNRVDEAMRDKRSIHAHFYTRENTVTLLEHVTRCLPFSSYHIRHTPNHRDFYWVLIKQL